MSSLWRGCSSTIVCCATNDANMLGEKVTLACIWCPPLARCSSSNAEDADAAWDVISAPPSVADDDTRGGVESGSSGKDAESHVEELLRQYRCARRVTGLFARADDEGPARGGVVDVTAHVPPRGIAPVNAAAGPGSSIVRDSWRRWGAPQKTDAARSPCGSASAASMRHHHVGARGGPSRRYPQLTPFALPRRPKEAEQLTDDKRIHENSFASTRRAARFACVTRRDSRPPVFPSLPPTPTRGAHARTYLDDHHRVRPRRALLPPRLISTGRPPRRWDRPDVTPIVPREPRRRPPWCSRRAADAWRPRTHADFLDGAYPGVDVVQLPAGLGWGANAPRRTTPDRAAGHPPPRWTSISPPSDLRRATRARLDRDSSVSSADARGRAHCHHPRVEPPPSTTPSSPISRASFDPKTKARTPWRDGAFSLWSTASSCAYANLLDAHPNARSPLRVRVQPNAVAGLDPRTPGSRRPYDRFGRRARLAPGRVVGFRRARRSARRRDGDV